MSSSILGIYQLSANPTDIANSASVIAYLTSASGGVITSTSVNGNESLRVVQASQYAEDAPSTSGDLGLAILAVRNDTEGSLAGTNGDYAHLQLDSLGRLRTVSDLNVNNDFVYAEDSAAANGDLGASILSVRQDTLASSTSADGDYASIKSTNLGELYVADSGARSSLASILAELASISQVEDAPHVSGDTGVMSLAVRNDAGTTLAGTNLDYAPLSLDANGNLRVSGLVSVNGQFSEDAPHSSGDIGLHSLAVRKDALSSNVSADGDYASLIQWSEGSLKVVDQPNIAVLQQAVSATTTAAALIATPQANRRNLLIQNRGTNSIFIGSATVTSAGATGGVEVPKGSAMTLEVGPGISLFAVTQSGSADVRLLELS